ncbi:hypothetical protein, conserved [Babesia bigemina]|uniref:Uncharacterized protein n=1 Tax=Babesia bigemina TaxID=5866 RepID=A0A061D3U1_BABBI|nr:hypothetical protein, conserved [Babesia bigemina]CDR95376.1 hypothetical protein, conserved [Babesia bigemina]|eukprot:XP_012767562.1 hypothetical protein, conserved [Babesia bigemina]
MNSLCVHGVVAAFILVIYSAEFPTLVISFRLYPTAEGIQFQGFINQARLDIASRDTGSTPLRANGKRTRGRPSGSKGDLDRSSFEQNHERIPTNKPQCEPQNYEKGHMNSYTDPLLAEFGIDLGNMGNDVFDWLWPKPSKGRLKRDRSKSEYIEKGGYLPRNNIMGTSGKSKLFVHQYTHNYNSCIQRYVLYNYAQEKLVDTYKRIAFHMRLSPRLLAREVSAVIGKFGMNILQPTGDEQGRHTAPDVLCLRRTKTRVFCILGRKLLKYHLLLLLRYIRLGIPPEIRERYVRDILTRKNIACASDMICSGIVSHKIALNVEKHLHIQQDMALRLTYPERMDFITQGYPYSSASFLQGDKSGWSPSNLVNEIVYERLSDKSKCKLVYMAAVIHPQYCSQIIKNVVYRAGYKCERDLLLKYCLGFTFCSRGAKAFVSKLKEERISDVYLMKAAQLAMRDKAIRLTSQSLDLLRNVPIVSGLIKRHIESGRKLLPIRTARVIFKRVRSHAELQPEDMILWDVLRETITMRIPNATPYILKQVRMEIFGNETFTDPTLYYCLKNRGIDTSTMDEILKEKGSAIHDMDSAIKFSMANKTRTQLRRAWLDMSDSNKKEMERLGLNIIDAMVVTAGYSSLNNLLVLVTMLSKRSLDQPAKCCQRVHEFERLGRLKLRDFKFSKLDKLITSNHV